MTSIIRISLNVANLARSQKFFTDLLGFRKSRVPAFAPPSAQSCVMALGDQAIELVEHHPPGAPYPPGSTACDLWFQHFAIVTADMPAAYARLRKAGATSISNDGPQTLPPEAGNVIAYKFRDPDGHPLELLQFPSNNTVRIDHSAISVSTPSAASPSIACSASNKPRAKPTSALRKTTSTGFRMSRSTSSRSRRPARRRHIWNFSATSTRTDGTAAREAGRISQTRRSSSPSTTREARGCPQSGRLFHRDRRTICLRPRSRRAWRRIGRTMKPSRPRRISTSGVLPGSMRHA